LNPDHAQVPILLSPAARRLWRFLWYSPERSASWDALEGTVLLDDVIQPPEKQIVSVAKDLNEFIRQTRVPFRIEVDVASRQVHLAETSSEIAYRLRRYKRSRPLTCAFILAEVALIAVLAARGFFSVVTEPHFGGGRKVGPDRRAGPRAPTDVRIELLRGTQ
jgi:hypothetical protein